MYMCVYICKYTYVYISQDFKLKQRTDVVAAGK